MIKNETTFLHSIGLISSWCFKKNFRTLFDCGDGCAPRMMQDIFGIENIFFSHSHADHINGLFSLIGLRNKLMGDNFKTLNIFYPAGDKLFSEYEAFCDKIYPKSRLKYDILWVPIQEGDEIYIRNKIYVKSFRTKHNANSFGYVIREESHRLKDGIDPKTVKEKIISGEYTRESITERKDINLFAYTLDNCGFDESMVQNVKEIVLDATFLKETDRSEKTHCTLSEAKDIAERINCDIAYFAHISSRYNNVKEIIYKRKEVKNE